VQPEDLRISARTRSGWEAIDLGFAMAQRWWRPIWGAWFLIVVPVALALIVALRGSPWWTLFLLWWLRPVFGRVVLHVLGEAMFGEAPSPIATARALPRILGNGLLASLTLLRFSPNRCYVLAVAQLEGSKGPTRRDRVRVLSRVDFAPAAAMHSVAAHINGALLLAMFALVLWMAPGAISFDINALFAGWSEAETLVGGVIVAGLYLVGMTVVEPLLVSGGFGLYLNRRIWLEGWDVEIALRGLARRSAQPTQVSSSASALGVVVVASLLLAVSVPTPAGAACLPDETESAAACINEVLQSDDFGHWEDVEKWVARERDWETGELPDWAFADSLGEGIATFFEFALWIGLAAGAVAVVVLFSRNRPGDLSSESVGPQVELFGLDLDPKKLPDDVIAAARIRFDAGDATGALSLLYRGVLVLLINGKGLSIPASATEGDCLGLVRDIDEPELLEDFSALNEAWVLSRYARTPVASGRFAELCQRWAPRLVEPRS
jgi:hypothetical protein